MQTKSLIFVFQITVFSFFAQAQDTVYARQVIKTLTSKNLLGRGYVNDGVNKAADFISKEMKSIGLMPFGKSYSQSYSFPVNTFPSKTTVTLDNRKLVAGKHYLIYPSAKTTNASYWLFQTDSMTYKANYTDDKESPLQIKLRKKLTYTVATELSDKVTIELLKDSFPGKLNSLKVDFENKWIPDFQCQNLCGYIQGTQKPDSFIVFTAHYDHLGAMGNIYFPGANDNASGVSVLLNLAKYYKSNPSKYSIAFIFFSGEEAGLLGSKYYSEHPLFPLSKIKFLTNLDLLGTGNDGIMVVNATVFKNQFDKLNQINTDKKYLSQIKQRGKAANSDHYWFTEKGVPSFFIYTMGGIQAYHDIYDIEQTLPLTDYVDVCKLLLDFTSKLQ